MRREIRDSSIVIISHQERILNIADEIIVLQEGRIKCQGSAEAVMPEIIGTESAIASCGKG